MPLKGGRTTFRRKYKTNKSRRKRGGDETPRTEEQIKEFGGQIRILELEDIRSNPYPLTKKEANKLGCPGISSSAPIKSAKERNKCNAAKKGSLDSGYNTNYCDWAMPKLVKVLKENQHGKSSFASFTGCQREEKSDEYKRAHYANCFSPKAICPEKDSKFGYGSVWMPWIKPKEINSIEDAKKEYVGRVFKFKEWDDKVRGGDWVERKEKAWPWMVKLFTDVGGNEDVLYDFVKDVRDKEIAAYNQVSVDGKYDGITAAKKKDAAKQKVDRDKYLETHLSFDVDKPNYRVGRSNERDARRAAASRREVLGYGGGRKSRRRRKSKRRKRKTKHKRRRRR